MKILAIGDLHGTFPKKLSNLVKKESIDLVISNGDYFPFHHRKLWFKHCYGTNTNLWEVIGKEKYKQLIKKDLADGEKSLKKLNALKVPVITVFGNVDYTGQPEENNIEQVGKSSHWKWDKQDFFTPMIKKYKNIKLFTHKATKLGDLIFIGAYGGTNPGHVKSKLFKKRKTILDKLFKKFARQNKKGKVIFVSHNVPYHTKLDKISMKANAAVRGKHYGSKLVRRIINKYQPIIHIGGHIHEGRGKQYIKNTLAINPGSAHENQAAIIKLEDNKQPRVKFIK